MAEPPYDLSAGISALHYRLRLEPDLDRFSFLGEVEIRFETRKPITNVTLNVLELGVVECLVPVKGREISCPFAVDPQAERIRVQLPEATEGEFSLRIRYMGFINDRMVGFYRSRCDSETGERYIATTQFQESDARRAFPCLDHPAAKATFAIELVADAGWEAVSNMPVKEVEDQPSGRKLVRFETTPKMSTYLLFFGVGELELLEEGAAVRAVTVPGRSRYARYGLEFGRRSLVFCEHYFGIPYPLPKMDLVAVPDFAYGAMENWGAITFRENLLLHYPGITSSSGEERICGVIAHEMAHQWFGNLVTPAEWRYLWLNESFATYFGYGVVHHLHPEWQIWEQFLNNQTEPVLDRDAMHETFSIEIPGGEHVVINAATAPIIYNKGGSVLRQLHGYLGEEDLQAGMQHYLKKFAYDCAASRDLWEALEKVSRKPVSRLMKSWVEQPGYPMLEVSRRGNVLQLEQRRFTFLPNDSDQLWEIPLTVRFLRRDRTFETKSLLMSGRQIEIPLPRDVTAWKVNERQSGFFRVKYADASNLEALSACVRRRELPVEDRWGLQNDLYALVRRGDLGLADYLGFLTAYEREDSFLPLMSIIGNLQHAFLVLEDSDREQIAGFSRPFLERILTEVGFDPREGEPQTRAILRDQALLKAGLYGSEATLGFAAGQFERLRAGQEISADIARGVMQLAAWRGDGRVFDWLKGKLRNSRSEHERMNILQALACFSDRALIGQALEFALREVPRRNQFVPLTAMAGNPQAVPFLWPWFSEHISELEQFHPLHFERLIAAFVPLSGLGREEQVKDFLRAYTGEKALARDVIRLSLERLEVNSRMKAREKEQRREA